MTQTKKNKTRNARRNLLIKAVKGINYLAFGFPLDGKIIAVPAQSQTTLVRNFIMATGGNSRPLFLPPGPGTNDRLQYVINTGPNIVIGLIMTFQFNFFPCWGCLAFERWLVFMLLCALRCYMHFNSGRCNLIKMLTTDLNYCNLRNHLTHYSLSGFKQDWRLALLLH